MHIFALKPIIEGPVKAEPLEGDMTPKKFALTLEEETKLEVCEKGRKGVALKISLTSIKEEVGLVTTKEPTKKRRRRLVKGKVEDFPQKITKSGVNDKTMGSETTIGGPEYLDKDVSEPSLKPKKSLLKVLEKSLACHLILVIGLRVSYRN
ncbi:hypothetical protein ACLOJK_021841 [Asimina triloba]